MTIREQLAKEMEDLPPKAQKKVLKLIHFVKKGMLVSPARRVTPKRSNALKEIDEIAIEIGISDFAKQHDPLAKQLDAKLCKWQPETANQVRQRITEIIELADHIALDVLRSRAVEQEVLDIMDAPSTR